MKRLLSILAAVTLVASASSPVVSCSLGSSVDESIAPSLEEQNFKALSWFWTHKNASIGDYLSEVSKISNTKDNEDKLTKYLLFSNGLTKDNKIMNTEEAKSSIRGSFNSNKWSFINLLNSKFNLGMKLTVNKSKAPEYKEAVRAKDVVKFVTPDISNLDKLNDLKLADYVNDRGNKVSAINSTTQGGGNPPEIGNDKTIDTFNEIINLGNNQNNDKKWWQEQVNFLKDSSKWKDYQLTRYENFADSKNKNFTFTQIIRLTNTVALNNYLFGEKKKDGTYPNNGAVDQLEKLYNKVFGNSENPNFTIDDLMNLVFSKLNIFTAQKQGYSVSVDLDCNHLRDQMRTAVDNIESVMSTYINSYNQKILYGLFEKDIPDNNRVTLDKVSIDPDQPGTGIIVSGHNISSLANVYWTVSGNTVKGVSANSDGNLVITLGTPLQVSDAEQKIKIDYKDPNNIDEKNLSGLLDIKSEDDQIISGLNIRLDKVDWNGFNYLPRDKADVSSFENGFFSHAVSYINDQINEQVAIAKPGSPSTKISSSMLGLDPSSNISGTKLDSKKDKIVLGAAASKPAKAFDDSGSGDQKTYSVTGTKEFDFDNNNVNDGYKFADSKLCYADQNSSDSYLKSNDYLGKNMSDLNKKNQPDYGETHYLNSEESSYTNISDKYIAENKLVNPKDINSVINEIAKNYSTVVYDAATANVVVNDSETINIVLTDENYKKTTLKFDIDLSNLSK